MQSGSPKLGFSAGERLPLGATVQEGGVNFAIFSPRATRVWLRLYRGESDAKPIAELELKAATHRTYGFWHVFVAGARAGWFYTWRADGPHEPAAGLRFDAHRELLDPSARLVSGAVWDREAAIDGDPAAAFRAEIAAADDYDWEGDEPLRRSLQDAVIYELHVAGYTRHPSSGVASPGTFRGLVDKIPHLQSLGITDVELLPVFAFDEQDVPADTAALGLKNFWGYSPVSFFAPHGPYAASGDVRREFRDMVKALHAAGIGVILDVVLNHTAEGGAEGPTIGYKGLVNELVYLLDAKDRSKYLDFTGCGNTVSSNQALVAQWLVEIVRFWAVEMHVDGFRFDLAGVLSRDEQGKPLAHAPVISAIELAPELSGVHLIAEAWDSGGIYQVGSFPGFKWAEWNDRYRNVVRRFLRGDPGHLGEIATRIAGSSDLYAWAGKTPQNGINFVTCHDGFTLYDLVSYGKKHNNANGEHNRDGRDDNWSWNSGLEGATDDARILRLREQRARNFIALLLLSQGVPMLTAGDEVLRTQRGNNNAYCQDNDVSWVDWSFSPAARAMLRFTRELIALRKRHPSLRRARFLNGHEAGTPAEIRWYGESLDEPDWQDAAASALCFTLAGVVPQEPALHVMINMAPTARTLPLPDPVARNWRRIADTTLIAPDDVVPAGVAVTGSHYVLAPHGIAIFENSHFVVE
ncbi:MAG TPA: glycogen debranching protein GlgX [Gammaproteobacteria bacterium]|nr:glycogen debranching protein GlgX [Gammaproteobacteria bacterium]